MCDFSQYGGPSEEWLAAEATFPALPAVTSMAQRKQVMNEQREKMAAEAFKLLSPKVRTQDYSVPTRDGSSIEARTYRPADVAGEEVLPVYFHLHGGGFFFGTLASEDATCASLALKARAVVLNVNYRHTPEHPYPAAWNDTEDAFEWLHDHADELAVDPQRVVIGGISAGAQLAATFVLSQHLGRAGTSRPRVAGQVLMIPVLVSPDCYDSQLKQLSDPSVSSYVQNENAAILPMSVARFFTGLLKIEDAQADDVRLNPGNASPQQVKGLPPTVFGICGWDILRDEGLLYAKLLTEAGVPTDVHMFPGLPHGFRRAGDLVADSKRWDKVMEDGIGWALSKPAATQKFEIKTE